MFWVFWLQGMWDLSSLTGDQTCTPCIERWSLNHWTTREVLRLFLSVIEMSDFYCWIAYCSFQFCQFCFMYFRALLLHVYTFIMCIFSWYSDSSVIIRCLSLSLVTFFVFKSLLSDINIAIPALYVEKAMAPHSSSLAWKIPWTEEPDGLQSMGSRRVGHNWATSLSLFTCMHWRRKWQPTPAFLPGESQGRGSLVGCRLWGRTESDTTEVT